MWCSNKLYVILATYCKRLNPKSPFYEKMKMAKKRTTILESFITIGSFDYDHTQKGKGKGPFLGIRWFS